MTGNTSLDLWRDLVKHAESDCAVTLKAELEAYLVTLLHRYTNQPHLVKQIMATAVLEALQKQRLERDVSLQHVGDQCLLFAGLFPRFHERRHVPVSYFVQVGQSAYDTIGRSSNVFFITLAESFVRLMDVLRSISQSSELLPLDAYEEWHALRSERALRILQTYSQCTLVPSSNRKLD